MSTHCFEQASSSISWGKRVPGQTADAPRWTDVQHAKCFTQLPWPWSRLIRKGDHIRAQPPPFSGTRAKVISQPGHREKASLNGCPRVSPHPGLVFIKGFPPQFHHRPHFQEPQGPPRQNCQVKPTHIPLPGGFQPRPSALQRPWSCQVQTPLALRPHAVLT